MRKLKPAVILIFVLITIIVSYNLVSSEGIVPWFQISITPYLQDTPSVAANTLNNQFLVVWEDWRGTSGFGTDVYAQLVNSDSTLDGANFLVTGVADWQRGPVVDYSPVANKYLVVWEEWLDDAHDVYGRLVNANGTTSGAQFPIAAAAEYQWNPDLAYGSTMDQYIVVFDDDRLVPGDKDINGQFVNSNGTLSGSNFTVSARARVNSSPAVAYNSSDDQFLVVWQDDRNSASDDDIYGRVVNANGTYDGGDFPISTAGPDQDDVDIAYASSSNLYLVVWEQSADIYGRLVNANKTLVGTEFQIASSSSGVEDPAVSFDPHSNQFLVIWSDATGWDNIYAQQVGVDGTMLDEDLDLITGTGDDHSPTITTNTSTNQFMVAWQRMTCHTTFDCDEPENNDKDIFGAFYQAAGNFKVDLPLILRGHAPLPLRTDRHGPRSHFDTGDPFANTNPNPNADQYTYAYSHGNLWPRSLGHHHDRGFRRRFSGWMDFSEGPGSGTGVYHWGRRNCRAYTGDYSGWAVGGGADGIGLACGSNYPNLVRSWMYYGPFSLADATDAELQFKVWINTQLTFDFVCRMASLDGNEFFGDCTSGDSGGWIDQVLDLSNVTGLPNVLGQSNVYVGLYFFSNNDDVVDTEGAFVDDIILRKCTTGGCTRNPMAYFEPESLDLIKFPLAITVNRP